MIFLSSDWYKPKNLSDYLPAVIFNLCRLLRVPVTLTGIRSVVKSHPFFPSLLSISESLERFGIKTEALKGTVQSLSENDYPSIAHLKNDKFVILENIEKGRVQFLDPFKGRIYSSLADFARIWSGVILRVTPGQDAGEKDYPKQRKEEIASTIRKFLILPGLALLTTIIFSYGLIGVENPVKLLLLWGVKLIGLVICLVMFNKPPFMQHFCSHGKKFDCLKVLNSPAGKIFGVSMTELGLLYFAGGLLALLFMLYMGHARLNIILLACLNLPTLPYTFFSIYYQAFVVNSWCLFCLSVQALLWIEFYLFFDSISIGFYKISFSLALPLIIGFVISSLIWIGLRPILIKAKRTVYLEQKFWSNIGGHGSNSRKEINGRP